MVLTEQQMEEHFVEKLRALKYTYRPDIRDRNTLEKNFRDKFEELNNVKLTDTEFSRLLEAIVMPDVFAASQILRGRNTFIREDGTPLTYTLVNIKDWCKNHFEVVNQLRINTDNSHHRYDVILLVNGVPVVQTELKALGVNPRRAMEQIVDYKKDVGNGYTRTLLCFIQLFIVSNRETTYYFANNNQRHFAFNADERFLPIYQFASRDNKKITHLDDFADTFLRKCMLGHMISRYMVLVSCEQKLLVMRPYQIYAVQDIVACIQENCGNGYIWHTTGSGKTLTSFKTATLLKTNPAIEKCLFVVDRKDLDRQTREEFNRFQEGCVEENTNTETLVRRLLSDDYADKVIVTTIQKLGLALSEESRRDKLNKKEGKATYKERLAGLRDKRMVFIFDECHRSQFGENHAAIKEFFPNAQLFGFTGTPIFEKNAARRQIEDDQASFKTTVDVFQRELHAYTITHAIEDKNVLRFHVDYYRPESHGDKKTLPPGEALTKQAVIEAILAKHDAATGNRRFNAFLATGSINDAIEYHHLFKTLQAKKQAADPEFVPLNIACVFSPPAQGDKDVQQLQEDLPQEKADNEQDPEGKKTALKAIIQDYNKLFGTNHSLFEFDLYYQDIQKRIKDQQFPNSDLPQAQKIDITIVVEMLLTGFDSKYLNTLYVDKNLKYHGLIQAFSRTNRVLNDTKPYGNILDFRQQQEAVDEAIAMFSGEKADRAREIWLVEKAPLVIEKLKTAKTDLDEFLLSQGLPPHPAEVHNLKGDDARIQFIKRFKEIQRLKTQLDQYTDLSDENKETIEAILPEEMQQAFRSVYLETAQRLKEQRAKFNREPNPELDQIDFEFVLFASALIDYDYIMKLIARFSQQAPGKEKMSRQQLIGLIQSDAKFIDEREIITEYVNSLKEGEGKTEAAIREGYKLFKEQKLTAELLAFAQKHALPGEALQSLVERVLLRMIFDGEKLTDLMQPLDLAWRERRQKELILMEDLVPYLEKRASGRTISGLSAYK